MTISSSYDLWRRALPLSAAYLRLAPQAAKERYAQLREENSFSAFAERLMTDAEALQKMSAEDRIKAFQNAALAGSPNEASELRRRLQSNLITLIQRGTLLALGFATPRQSADLPVEVPMDLWQGTVHWDKSAVAANGLRIESVRVFPATWLQTESKRAGRPSRADEILRAYHDLKGSELIDYSGASLKAIAAQVQERIVRLNPNHPDGLKGIGEKAIQLAIADDVRAQKAAKKKL